MRRFVLVAGLTLVAVVAVYGLLQATKPAWYLRLRYPLAHDQAINAAAARNRLDPALVAAVIYRESKFRRDVSSHQGAVGLMQVLPSTAQEIARKTGGTQFVIGDLTDPQVNILYGSYYLRQLLDKYDGDLVAAVAAYNAGEGNVDAWLSTGGGKLRLSDIPFTETRQYVADVLQLRQLYRRAYGDRLASP